MADANHLKSCSVCRESIPQAPMTQKLARLAKEMQEIAADMDYYGGFDSEAVDHARELIGASKVVEQWAEQWREQWREAKNG